MRRPLVCYRALPHGVVAAREHCEALLWRILGQRVPLRRDARGKPSLPGSPWDVSFSHSGRWAVVALAGTAVGVDVEVVGPMRGLIAERFFTPSEREALRKAGDTEDARWEFHRIWVRKEAYAKSLGVGWECGFDTISALSQPSGRSFFDLRLGSECACALVVGQSPSVPTGRGVAGAVNRGPTEGPRVVEASALAADVRFA